MVISLIQLKDMAKVPFAEDDDVVKAVPSNRLVPSSCMAARASPVGIGGVTVSQMRTYIAKVSIVMPTLRSSR